MAYSDLKRHHTTREGGQLTTRHHYYRPSGTTTYNFNNRAMLTDRPYYGTTPLQQMNTQPHFTELYPMDVQHSHQPNIPGRRVVSTNAPDEYRDRFYSRPTGRPNVVGIDGRHLTTRSGRHDNRGFNGFFPSVKFRVSTPTKPGVSNGEPSPARSKSCKDRAPDTPKSSRGKSKSVAPPPFILELAPERLPSPKNSQSPSTRHSPTTRSTSGRSTKTAKSNTTTRSSVSNATSVSKATSVSTSQVSARTSQGSIRTVSKPAVVDFQPPVYPYIIENPQVEDLTELPKPMMVVSRDNPWVYRYKVKRSMNELSKILASKPPPTGASQSAFIH